MCLHKWSLPNRLFQRDVRIKRHSLTSKQKLCGRNDRWWLTPSLSPRANSKWRGQRRTGENMPCEEGSTIQADGCHVGRQAQCDQSCQFYYLTRTRNLDVYMPSPIFKCWYNYFQKILCVPNKTWCSLDVANGPPVHGFCWKAQLGHTYGCGGKEGIVWSLRSWWEPSKSLFLNSEITEKWDWRVNWWTANCNLSYCIKQGWERWASALPRITGAGWGQTSPLSSPSPAPTFRVHAPCHLLVS